MALIVGGALGPSLARAQSPSPASSPQSPPSSPPSQPLQSPSNATQATTPNQVAPLAPSTDQAAQPVTPSKPEPASTPSKIWESPVRGFVAARMAVMVRSANKTPPEVIVHLRQGDSLEVLELKDRYYRVRYQIEGDFPVEGWIQEEAVNLDSAQDVRPTDSQRYQAKDEEEEVPSPTDFPAQTLKERPEIKIPTEPSPQQKQSPSESKAPKKDEYFKPLFGSDAPEGQSQAKNPFWHPIQLETKFRLLYRELSESLTTQEASGGSRFSEPFLKYSLEGISGGAQLIGLYPINDFKIGASFSYDFSIYSGSVESGNENIIKSRVQGLRHDFALGIIGRWFYNAHPWFQVEPEFKLIGAYHYYSINQLADRDLNNATRDSQPVLFGHHGIEIQAELSPRLYAPYQFTLIPFVGVTFLSLFNEFPIVGDVLRTGRPDGSKGLPLHYGVTLHWIANVIDLPKWSAEFVFRIDDESKSFKGQGNRAGFHVLNAKAKSEVTSLGFFIGYKL